MPRARDHKAEYSSRIASAERRGLSRSQGRGHARHGEAPAKPLPPVPHDDRLEAGLRLLRQTGNQGSAAKEAGVSPERLRRFLRENALAERRGRQWHFSDNRPRRMTVISGGEALERVLLGFDQASLNGQHLNAVRQFLGSNDRELLFPFEGQAVIDANGRTHPLETDPNTLHRIAAQGEEVFHNVYRLIQ